MDDPATLQDRLDLAFGRASDLLEICRVPSLSVGVLHRGEVVFTKSVGLRVFEQAAAGGSGNALPATPETAYLIASCSKIILACAVGILVDEGKMSWHDPIRKYVPDFNTVGDKRISEGATIRHAMCHTTGLGRQNPLIQGIKGNVLVEEGGFVALVNHAATHDAEQFQYNIGPGGTIEAQAQHSDRPSEVDATEEDQTKQAGSVTTPQPRSIHSTDQDGTAENKVNDSFQDREFSYNNYAMALVGLAVQNASGQRYSTFVQKRILDPLGMDGTIVTRSHMKSHQNVAVGYVKLKDNTFSEVATESQTDDAHTPILSVIGVRSSVDDMLKLAKAMISAYGGEVDPPQHHDQRKLTNPLRQLSTIWKSWVEIEDGLSYGMGCYKMAFPSESFSSCGINAKTRSSEPEFFKNHVLGQDWMGPPPEHTEQNVISHIGYNNGFTSSVTIFPRSQTTIVAFANGMDLGDPADWSVKILAQALFETTPQVNILALATTEADLWRRWFDKILLEWLADRRTMHQESDLTEYVGDYQGLNTMVHIFLDPSTAHLAMEINSCEGSRFNLELYGYDTYSFLPLTKDEWLRNGMWDWDEYYVAVLYFHRDDDGEVYSFSWRYEADEEDGHFYRTQGTKSS